MPSPRPPASPPAPADRNLGNAERGRAHWPLDLELHPEREDKLPEGPPPSADDDEDDE